MLVNPGTLYSGGNVRLDSTPYLRIAFAQQARKQALQEASNQYFSRLPDKLNTAGVRTQDLENDNGGILKDLGDIKDYWFQNKDEISKGGMAQQKYFQQIEKAKQNIQQSKDRAKLQLTIGKEALKPNGWKPREEDHAVLEAMDRPINDPTSKKHDGVSDYGINDLSLAAAPYTDVVQLKHNKAIEGGIVPDRIPTDQGVLDPTALKVTYNYGYTPEKVDAIAKNAIADVQSNQTMKYHYEDMLNDPTLVETASKALQAEYDKQHNDGQKVVVDTPEEMAAGLAYDKYSKLTIPKTFTDKKSIEDFQLMKQQRQFKHQEKMAYLNDRLIRGRAKDGLVNADEVGFPTDEIAGAYGQDIPLYSQSGKELGTKKVVYADKVPTAMMRTINPTDYNKNIYPVKPLPIKQADGSIKMGYYYNEDGSLEGEGGRKIGRDDARELYIKDRVPTKQKLAISSKGHITTPSITTPKKAKFD